MKKPDLRFTILFSGRGMTLEVHDQTSGCFVLKAEFSPEQACDLLGRHAMSKCESFKVYDLSRVGKKLEHRPLEFKLPYGTDYKNREEVAKETASRVCPEGWKPDDYFGSQGSFFTQDGVEWARVTIRRWVEIEG